MATTLTTVAVEESTYVITIAFEDKDGDAMTPLTVVWTLTDSDGAIINSRSDVSATPATSINIVLTGDDLGCSETGTASRTVTVSATYNSTYGSGLHLKKASTFTVENLVAIT